MLKKSILVLLFSSSQLFAQTQNEFWSKISLTKKIDKHWAIGLDAQYRRQSDFYTGEKNIFRFPLTTSARFWAYYKIKNRWTFIVSPIGFFDNKNLKSSYGTIINSRDLRSMIGAAKTYIFGKFVSHNRLLYEADLLAFDTRESIIRQRYRLFNNLLLRVLNLDEMHSLNYNFFNEIFYKTQSKISSFDQDHFYNGIQWKFKQSDINLGYQYTYQKSGISYLKKNQLLVFLNLAL